MSGDWVLAPVTLILGGARSGKSALAERLAEQAASPIYIATAQALDEEMRERIAVHQARRGPRWSTVEEPLELAGAITRLARPEAAVVVDCLTLWLSNLMLAGRDIGGETHALVAVLQAPPGPVILISNEVGLGIVPDNPLARAFRDHAGCLHQTLAALAQRVYFTVAGLPMLVKNERSSE